MILTIEDMRGQRAMPEGARSWNDSGASEELRAVGSAVTTVPRMVRTRGPCLMPYTYYSHIAFQIPLFKTAVALRTDPSRERRLGWSRSRGQTTRVMDLAVKESADFEPRRGAGEAEGGGDEWVQKKSAPRSIVSLSLRLARARVSLSLDFRLVVSKGHKPMWVSPSVQENLDHCARFVFLSRAIELQERAAVPRKALCECRCFSRVS